jgi:hypothetical protein
MVDFFKQLNEGVTKRKIQERQTRARTFDRKEVYRGTNES